MFFERHEHADQELPVYFNYQIHSAEEPLYEMHWHETREWIYLVKGRIKLRMGDRTEEYGEGDIITIAPKLPHSLQVLDGFAGFYCLIPDNSIFSSCAMENLSVECDALVTSPEIRRIFLELIKEYKEKRPYYKSCIRAKLITMLSLLFREHGHEARESDAEPTDRAMQITKDMLEYMEAHYAEELDGERIAVELGFSRSYICHVISRVTGKSLTENLSYIRCRKARQLLQAGCPVGETAFTVGFQNAPYFCRVYKRIMGVPPSAHLKE